MEIKTLTLSQKLAHGFKKMNCCLSRLFVRISVLLGPKFSRLKRFSRLYLMLIFVVSAGIGVPGCDGSDAQSASQAGIEIQPDKIPTKEESVKPGEVKNIQDRASGDTDCELPANMQ